MKKISVVTVCFNCVDTIEQTIKSVISQDYTNLEYIVIDGASRDGTLAVVDKYQELITKVLSEPDRGIFDAMNKSLKYVTGEYVLFMNAGDTFVSAHTVSDVFRDYKGNDDLIYGDDYVLNDLGYMKRCAHAIYERPFTKHDLVFKSQGFSHQSLFTKTEALKRVGFCLEYPLGADYHTTYKVFVTGNHKLKYVGFPISVFDDRNGGASHNGLFMLEIYKERVNMFKYHITWADWCILSFRKCRTNIKYYIQKTFPRFISFYRIKRRNYLKTFYDA